MLTTQTSAADAALRIASQMQCSGPGFASRSPSQAPVLFAVPAPSSIGKGLLCLCRKVYWTSASLMYCAYAPVTKDEAAKLLRDPSVINILSNPVAGSNLLTVSSNGAIIGVQQTVGYLQENPQSPVVKKQATRSVKKRPTVTALAPNEAQKVPAETAALPQPTSTPSYSHTARTVAQDSSSTYMLPKIKAVFTLADTSINSVTLNKQTAKVESTKDSMTRGYTQNIVPHALSQSTKQVTKQSPILPACKVLSPVLINQQSSVISNAKASSTKLITKQTPVQIESQSKTQDSKQSFELSAAQDLSTHIITKQSPAIYVNEALSTKQITKQSHAVHTESQSTRNPATSFVLLDVQNKVQGSQDYQTNPVWNVQGTGVKRNSDIAKLSDILDKKRKLTPAGALKVKFTWSKRWAVHSQDESNSAHEKMSGNLNMTETPSQCTFPEKQCRAQTNISEKQSSMQVNTASGNIVINDHQGYTFSSDIKYNMVAINGMVPLLSTLKKQSLDDLVKLGCNPFCPRLRKIVSATTKVKAPVKTVKKKPKKMQHKGSVPEKMLSLDALTRHPDCNHIPTGDKVAYLKEVLRLQRAALGITV